MIGVEKNCWCCGGEGTWIRETGEKERKTIFHKGGQSSVVSDATGAASSMQTNNRPQGWEFEAAGDLQKLFQADMEAKFLLGCIG